MKIFYIMRKPLCMADMKDFKNILSGDYRWISLSKFFLDMKIKFTYT